MDGNIFMIKSKYVKPDFKVEKRVDIGPCKYKGRKDFCNGKNNFPSCPAKYAFFGLIASQGGWKNYELIDEKNETCPEYVEWGIPYKGKTEYVAIVDGGQLASFKKGVKGPCIFQVMKSTNTEIIKILDDLFSLVKKDSNEITEYLQKNLDAPSNIKEKTLKIISNYNKPLFEK